MDEPIISVIVPVYKVEKYLLNCVQTILSQSLRNFEIILVDDGSPDGSGKICDELEKKCKQIKVIHQENKGVSAARAAGVKAALGKWICFVDSDDSLPPKSLETLLNEVTDETDIVVGQVQFNGCYSWPFPKVKRSFDSGWDFIKAYRKIPIHMGPCAKIFAHELFNSETFDLPRELTNGEDFIMNIRLALRAKRVSVIPDNVYLYADVSTGASKNNVYTKASYHILFYRHLLKSFERTNVLHFKTFLFLQLLLRFKSFFKENLKSALYSIRKPL